MTHNTTFLGLISTTPCSETHWNVAHLLRIFQKQNRLRKSAEVAPQQRTTIFKIFPNLHITSSIHILPLHLELGATSSLNRLRRCEKFGWPSETKSSEPIKVGEGSIHPMVESWEIKKSHGILDGRSNRIRSGSKKSRKNKQNLVGGWTNPSWKICASQIGSWNPKVRGKNKKKLSCHHLEKDMHYLHLNWCFFRSSIYHQQLSI